ncbi:MAG TPA: hypothetical protein VGM51_17465 [Armatimonadota bacterium]|jgi:hypothetical protein
MNIRAIAFGLLFCIGASIVPVAALANEQKAKNTAIGVTAISAYLLSQKKSRNAGIVGAAGSVYLWKKYDDSKKARRKRALAQQVRYRRHAAYANSRSASQRRYAVRQRSNRAKAARAAWAR